jgi:3-isopropylmalate/(R)-2-methylmalate dehydratase small subunit
MEKILRGRVWKFGDNIDTDIITPGDTISFGLGDSAEVKLLVENAFRSVRPQFYKQVKKGDILVAGRNFGLGSHREPANTALVNLGFSAVIAESIARLFFRNSMAIGFHSLPVPGISALVEEGEILEIDFERWTIRNVTTRRELKFEPYSPLVRGIFESGGIISALRKRIAGEGT